MGFLGEITATLRGFKGLEDIRVKVLGGGIRRIYGFEHGHEETQAFRFKSSDWSIGQAKRWLHEQGIKAKKIEPAKATKTIPVTLQCYAQKLTKEEIMKAIDADVFQAIKERDEKPLFKAYSICHEGVSHPKIIGEGTQYIKWPRRAVRSVQAFIGRIVNFFRGHGATNDTQGREKLGEVVGNLQKEIDGKLHHIVIGYIPPEKRRIVDKLPIPSMEAEWIFTEQNGRLVAERLEKMTGIALGDETKIPGFGQAAMIGAVQAFDEDEPDNHKRGKPGKPRKEHRMTKEEVKQAVIDLNIWPSQLYSEDKIKADHEFRSLFEEPVKQIGELTKERDALKQERDVLKTASDELTAKYGKATVKEKFAETLKTKKPTDKEKAYIESVFDDLADFTDTGVDAFIESRRKHYAEKVAPLIEPPKKTPQETGDGKSKNPFLIDEDEE